MPTVTDLTDWVARHRAVAIGSGLLAILIIFAAADSGRAPFGVILEGGVYGSVNGLLALGLVLTYRSDRIVNFAYGAMGGVGGTVGVLLYLSQHWSYPACIIAGLVCGAVVGALTELLVIRRFARTSRLILTVATIGLAQLLGGIQVLLPRWLGGSTLIGGFSTALSGHSLNVGPVLFTGDDLLAVAAVPFALIALGWFLLRTDSGTAVRAIADNRDRALLLGVPVRRLATVVWTVAGVIATLAVLLPAPTQGLTIDAAAGPTLLLPALAAAVIAGMESLPIAVFAGIGLGILDSIVRWNVNKQAVTTVVFLGIILVALLLNSGPRGRRAGGDESSLSTVEQRFRELPAALRRLPEVIALRSGGVVAMAAAAVLIPLACSPSTIRLFSIALIYGMVAVSLVLLSGWAGEVSLGQYAFVGLGAVFVGDLMNHWNIDLFVCLVGAALAGGVLAVLIGLPALRIRGLNLAVTTLALAVAMDAFFLNPVNFNSLIPGTIQRPVLWKRFDLHSERALYYLCLGILVLVIVIVRGLRHARPGRVMVATRDNELAAAAMAVPTTRVRLVGFVASGAIAGIAGGLHATILQSVGFGTYPPTESLLVFSMVVIGGIDSIAGALLGVGLIELAVHLWPTYQLLITGVGLLVILMVLPGGLATALFAVRDRLAIWLAKRRGIDLTRAADGSVAPAPAVIAAATDSDALLQCRGVQARYGAMQVLFGVDLDVREGETVALLGTNGAGKSTMLKAVSGLMSPSPGRVHFAGRDVTSSSATAKSAGGLAMMPAKAVFPSLSVNDNLRVAGWLIRRDRGEIASGRERVLALFPQLRDRETQPAGNLSGGEQQMLSLAMALLRRPRMLLIDELSLGLAPTVVRRLLDVVRALPGEGVTVLIVEQSVDVALQVAERAVFLERGEVRFAGATADLLERPDVLRSVFISGAQAVSSNGDRPSRGKRAAAANGRRSPAYVKLLAQPEVLQCYDVGVSFGPIRALDSIDIALHKGEILGLIGHNGAGKTTLFDVISGFRRADQGRVLLGGADVNGIGAPTRAVLGLGRSFQEARLFPALTVTETVSVALERHLASRDLVAAGLRLPASTMSEALVAERVQELLEQLGLSRYAEAFVGELSTGTRRIVELACVLAQDPAVLLLDEPTAGVAQRETEALGPLLRKVRDDTGCTMLVIDHDMPLLTSLCDRLVALELGRVIADGPPEEVLHHPLVVASYLGTDLKPDAPTPRKKAASPRKATAPRKAASPRKATSPRKSTAKAAAKG
ncbi:MAG TPA: ATP-binding cassette domain-containing protein [Mycobacteriales bacterium]|nr:ATP-binding cassette domain-containing protein [Mycobacteriales bacterium]